MILFAISAVNVAQILRFKVGIGICIWYKTEKVQSAPAYKISGPGDLKGYPSYD
jgi:hypothetical protein